MNINRKDLGAGVGKAQDVKPLERVNAGRYRKNIYNMMMNSLRNRDTKRNYVYQGTQDLILELERVMGRKIHELCGEGKEGLKRVILKYKGIGGVYAMINLKNNKVYVGSSSDLSARFRFYVSRIKINPEMTKDTERGWDGFIIVIVLKEEEKTRREDEEYSIIRKVLKSLIFPIYNVFVRKEDKERYGEKVTLLRRILVMKEGVRGVDKWVNRYIIKGKMSRIAKERGYGERQKKYWFKKGVEHPKARKEEIRIIDIETGLSKVVQILEASKETEGSRVGPHAGLLA